MHLERREKESFTVIKKFGCSRFQQVRPESRLPMFMGHGFCRGLEGFSARVLEFLPFDSHDTSMEDYHQDTLRDVSVNYGVKICDNVFTTS